MRKNLIAIVSTADGKTKKYKAVLNCGRRIVIPGCTAPITAIRVRCTMSGRPLPAALQLATQNEMGAVFIPHFVHPAEDEL